MKIALPWRTWILFSYCFFLSFSGLGQNFHISRVDFESGFSRVQHLGSAFEVGTSDWSKSTIERRNFASFSFHSEIKFSFSELSSFIPTMVSNSKIDSSTHFVDLTFIAASYAPESKLDEAIGQVCLGIKFFDFKGHQTHSFDSLILDLNIRESIKSIHEYLNDDFDEWYRMDLIPFLSEEESALECRSTAIAAAVLAWIVEQKLNVTPSKQALIEIKQTRKKEDYSLDEKMTVSVSLRIGKRYISGTLLGDEYLLTDARGFKSDEAYVFFSDSDSALVELVRKDNLSNIGLARFKTPLNLDRRSVMSLNSFVGGEQYRSFGTAGSLDFQDTFVRLCAVKLFKHNGTDRLLLDGAAHIGYSGAPLFSQKNELVGVLIASDLDEENNIVFTGFSKSEIEKALNIQL